MDQYLTRKIQIEHAIKTGLGLVVKDRNNNIVFVGILFDYMDPPNYNNRTLSLIAKKRKKICDVAMMHNKERMNKIESGNIKYGQIIDFGVGVTNPNATHLGIWSTIFAAAHSLLIIMGYDHYNEESVNPITAGILEKHYRKYGQKFYLSKSVFDYKHMVREELKSLRKTLSTKHIKYLEDNAKIYVYIDDYKSLRKQNNFKDVREWFMFMVDAFSPSKL